MDIIHGKVRELLSTTDGVLCGFVVDGGLEVHFSMRKRDKVAAVVSFGSRLEICGNPYSGASGDPRIEAQFIANLDSKRSANLQESPSMHNPEMSPTRFPAPGAAASLVPPQLEQFTLDENPTLVDKGMSAASIQSLQNATMIPADFACSNASNNPIDSAAGHERAGEYAAASSIEVAYDSIHRAQALLAYIKIVNIAASESPDMSQPFDESRRIYQQALESYRRGDYAVAGEFAAASNELCRSVEMIASRTLREDSSYPTLVPYPPRNPFGEMSSGQAESRLAQVGKRLTRIHWLVQNGTMPSEDREQVKRIVSWSDMLYAKGRQALQVEAIGDASYFIATAEAIAHSAEHVCKQDYIVHASVTS